MRKSLIQIIREDYAWFLNQRKKEDSFDELYPTQEQKFEYYLDAVLNNNDGISGSIRTDIIYKAIQEISCKDL